jgi:hypothetical protein
MYARKASLTESASKFLEKIEHGVVPLLRKQKGFLDQLTALSDSGEIIYIYTFGKATVWRLALLSEEVVVPLEVECDPMGCGKSWRARLADRLWVTGEE